MGRMSNEQLDQKRAEDEARDKERGFEAIKGLLTNNFIVRKYIAFTIFPEVVTAIDDALVELNDMVETNQSPKGYWTEHDLRKMIGKDCACEPPKHED